MTAKRTMFAIDAIASSRGVTYTVPHSTIDENPPYDLSQATGWERQEIKAAWRDAQKAAREMMDCGILWIERLGYKGLDHARHMSASGGSIPITGAQKLTLALVKLNEKLACMEHRIVMMGKEEL